MKSEILKGKRNNKSSLASETLKRLQSLPLEQKILLSERRISEWAGLFNNRVYVSFSGGRDSTALLHLVRNTSLYPYKNITVP